MKTKKPKKPKAATVKRVEFAVKTEKTCEYIRQLLQPWVEDEAKWIGGKLHRKVKVTDEGER